MDSPVKVCLKQLCWNVFSTKFHLFLCLKNVTIMSMRLPNRKNAIIRREKLIGYLLSLTDKDGRPKAEYFRKIGFNEANLKEFERALLTVVENNEVKTIEKYDFGVKYAVEGLMDSPSGKRVMVRTVWSIDRGEKAPRLVTAYHV